ncbi:MAG: hypothetical protein ACKOWF_18795 [Chloroflexota bacterium]
MNSSMIGKIEKAHRYAMEPERVTISQLSAKFRGGHDDYTVSLDSGHWSCSCHTFETHVVGTCAHIMALQQMLAKMLTEDARFETGFEDAADPIPAGA